LSAVFELSDHYVDRFAALEPIAATFEGIEGHDTELTDYSPAGDEERAELDRSTLRALAAAPIESDADRLAAGVLRERLETQLAIHDAGEGFRRLNVLASPVQEVRMVFDLMPTASEADWAAIAARMSAVPDALDSARDAWNEGVRQGLVAAQRQVASCAQQAAVWSGTDQNGTRPFFLSLFDRFVESGIDAPGLRADLEHHAGRASEAYASLSRYLTEEYWPHATEHDPVGADRYALWARAFNGTELDLLETYAWGWEELHRIERAMGEVAERILPGRSIPEVIELLETDPARAIEGEANLRAWLQDLMDRTIAELDGVHFDIADPLKRVEAMIAPPGGAAAMYYTGPSEDFSRPGRTWYPTLGRTRFPLWGEVSICYHEGVPGHHLQIAQVRYLADRLSRYQRTLGFVSGHGEGWALYAERLMGELGYLDVPDYELGMLRAQAMRAVRVVVDIGLHLELPIDATERYHPGERWTPELALPFVIERSWFPEDFMRSEVDRYLGLPGQAISYKVGERVWLDARNDAKQRHGADFDLKAWHEYALDLGSMGLDQLRDELARF
jgi:uncharacterized protein (DUF885 family)